MRRYTVSTDRLNIRSSPAVTAGRFGFLARGQRVDVIEIQPGPGSETGWAKCVLAVSRAQPATSDGRPAEPVQDYAPEFVEAWLAMDYLTPEAPLRAQRTYPKCGANFPSGNLHLAQKALAGGANAFLIIDDFLYATQLSRNPGVFVVARRGDPAPKLTGNLAYDTQRMVDMLEGAAGGPNLCYVGLNEGDTYGFSITEIAYRAKFDIAMAQRVRAISGAKWAAWCMPMGNPEYDDAGIRRAIRDGYADAYNSGLLLVDVHNYVPNPEDIDNPDRYRWWATRHHRLFGQGADRCGFDPRVKGVIHGETGVDGGGGGRISGGMLAFGMTAQQALAFHRSAYRLAGQPIYVEGQWYESPTIAMMYFQVGSAHWGGFDMQTYLDTFAGNWQCE